jgi:hypothetical protein
MRENPSHPTDRSECLQFGGLREIAVPCWHQSTFKVQITPKNGKVTPTSALSCLDICERGAVGLGIDHVPLDDPCLWEMSIP